LKRGAIAHRQVICTSSHSSLKEFLFMTKFLTVSTLLACGVLLLPGIARARVSGANGSASADLSTEAASVAAQMVPAQAVLEKELDARKTQVGQQFSAALTSTVHLKSGTDLPRGTVLLGTVAVDNSGGNGGSTLALRFTQAQIKSGKTVPIEATIVGIAPPSDSTSWDGTDVQAPPDPWNGSALQVDQIGVLHNVDLHSKIADKDSGVFVSNRKEDMKFAAKSQISLAIGAPGAEGMNAEN
jgi:hypothetical protein